MVQSLRLYQTAAIHLQGKWLEDLGFEIGDIINVECRDGKLVITKADEIEVEVVG
jgi:toxic protein SymE